MCENMNLKKWPWNLLNDILKDEAKVEDIFNNPQ